MLGIQIPTIWLKRAAEQKYPAAVAALAAETENR